MTKKKSTWDRFIGFFKHRSKLFYIITGLVGAGIIVTIGMICTLISYCKRAHQLAKVNTVID
jgi:hypothetical protein